MLRPKNPPQVSTLENQTIMHQNVEKENEPQPGPSNVHNVGQLIVTDIVEDPEVPHKYPMLKFYIRGSLPLPPNSSKFRFITVVGSYGSTAEKRRIELCCRRLYRVMVP